MAPKRKAAGSSGKKAKKQATVYNTRGQASTASNAADAGPPSDDLGALGGEDYGMNRPPFLYARDPEKTIETDPSSPSPVPRPSGQGDRTRGGPTHPSSDTEKNTGGSRSG